MLQKILYIKNALSVQWNSQLSAVLPGEGFQIRLFFQIISTSPYLSPSHLAVGCVPDNEVRILLLLSLAWHQFARGGLSPV